MNLRRKKKKFIIPMNSMSDVAFLLLIFIMLVSLMNYRREVKIDYPEAETAKKNQHGKKHGNLGGQNRRGVPGRTSQQP